MATRSLLFLAALHYLLGGQLAAAIELDPTSADSVKDAASTIVYGMMKYYTGNQTGDTPGNLPDPYYWWETGGMFGHMVDYYYCKVHRSWPGKIAPTLQEILTLAQTPMYQRITKPPYKPSSTKPVTWATSCPPTRPKPKETTTKSSGRSRPWTQQSSILYHLTPGLPVMASLHGYPWVRPSSMSKPLDGTTARVMVDCGGKSSPGTADTITRTWSATAGSSSWRRDWRDTLATRRTRNGRRRSGTGSLIASSTRAIPIRSTTARAIPTTALKSIIPSGHTTMVSG